MLEQKDPSPNSQVKKLEQRSAKTVREMMHHKANDNTPPVFHWFYKLLILSLVIFSIIEAIAYFFG